MDDETLARKLQEEEKRGRHRAAKPTDFKGVVVEEEIPATHIKAAASLTQKYAAKDSKGHNLDAPSHLYTRSCPSVRRSVGPSHVIFEAEKYAYEAHLVPCIRSCFYLFLC